MRSLASTPFQGLAEGREEGDARAMATMRQREVAWDSRPSRRPDAKLSILYATRAERCPRKPRSASDPSVSRDLRSPVQDPPKRIKRLHALHCLAQIIVATCGLSCPQ